MSEIMTAAEIEELRALEAAATPGPWESVRSDPAEGVNCWWLSARVASSSLYLGCIYGGYGRNDNAANAALIAAARNALPKLLATIEDYASELMRLETEIGNLHYDRASLNVALTKAQAENERLRAALEPFAALSDAAANACCMVGDVGDGLIVGDFRRARAALKGGDADA